jgi:hypothetical protein
MMKKLNLIKDIEKRLNKIMKEFDYVEMQK